jgi:SAM-dependent methyltransferase
VKEDWQDPRFVEWYNQNLRFEEQRVEAYIAPLNLCAQDSFVDFGCGNGTLLEKVAPLVKSALGIDGSAEQLLQARERLKATRNVDFINAGFLGCDLDGRTFTKASARKALHHLTDDQKLAFFKRISVNFTPGALFVLEDGIFDFPKTDLKANWGSLMDEARAYYGKRWEMIKDAFTHTHLEEFPTDRQSWQDAFQAGGFEIIKYDRITCFYGKLVARKSV